MIWRRMFGLRRREADLDEEIRSHLRMAAGDRIEGGEDPEVARLAALREFGNVGLVKETTHAFWLWASLEQILQDFRAAFRILTKSPGFSAAAITLVAMGIGWNTTIYSIIHGILTKPAAGVEARDLVAFGLSTNGRPDEPEHSYPDYVDFVAQSKTVHPILAFGFDRLTATLKDGTYAFNGVAVTPNYFETLGVRLLKGRSFSGADLGGLAAGVPAVISYRAWLQQFHKSEDIVGRSMLLNGFPATIIGVASENFHGTWLAADLDVWIPIIDQSLHRPSFARELNERSRRNLIILGRLAPGASLIQAQAEFAIISKRLQAAYLDTNKGRTVLLAPYSAAAFAPVQRAQARLFMAILTVVAILTLLVVCANVANLILARAFMRQREMAVRQSIGASRGRVLRMLLAEGLVLSVTALVAAWLFSVWACHALIRLMPPNGRGVRVEADFTPDVRVMLYAMLLTIVSALVFTAAPALRAWTQELLPWLKAGEHSVAQGRSRLSDFLVITQLALCVLLLIGAGLAYRSLTLINGIDLGFRRDHLLLVTVNTSGAAGGRPQNLALLERIRERLRTVPGVSVASYARVAPPRSWSGEPVQGLGSGQPSRADGNFIGPDYLEALGVSGIRGRGISAEEFASGKPAAVINRNLAETLWPAESAIGRTLLFGRQKLPLEVVGVVPNGAFSGFLGADGEFAGAQRSVRRGFVFLSEAQSPGAPGERTFHLRYTVHLEAIVPAVRGAIRSIDSRVPIAFVRTMDDELNQFTAPILMVTSLLGLFAIGSLILATIGLHSVVAFHTARRRREFGIRIALGASYRQIVDSVLKEGLVLTSIGLATGLALSAAAGRTLRNLLFGLSPTDAPTYAAVVILLAAVSLVACYIPARRAARTAPTEALRQE